MKEIISTIIILGIAYTVLTVALIIYDKFFRHKLK